METSERCVLKRWKEYFNGLVNEANERRLDREVVVNGEVRRDSKEVLEDVK